jgi:hypothetical protein
MMKIKGTGGTKPAAGRLKKLVSMLSHYECIEQGEGLWQIDLVQHDGGNPTGEFCYTLTITEVKNAWTVLKTRTFKRYQQASKNDKKFLASMLRRSGLTGIHISHGIPGICSKLLLLR